MNNNLKSTPNWSLVEILIFFKDINWVDPVHDDENYKQLTEDNPWFHWLFNSSRPKGFVVGLCFLL